MSKQKFVVRLEDKLFYEVLKEQQREGYRYVATVENGYIFEKPNDEWEYLTKVTNTSKMDSLLNKYGKLGWELANSYRSTAPDHFMMILKRKL